MKTILYAIGAIALATTAAQAANDGFQVQSENLAVTRGDYSQAERPTFDRSGPVDNVRLQRNAEQATPREKPMFAPTSDDWMHPNKRDTVYGN